jgi:hypothetical protein
VATRTKVWVCGRSLAGIASSNPAGGMDVCLSVVSVVCCQVEVSATSWSLVQKSTKDCGVYEYDHESSTMRKNWTTWVWWKKKKKKKTTKLFSKRIICPWPNYNSHSVFTNVKIGQVNVFHNVWTTKLNTVNVINYIYCFSSFVTPIVHRSLHYAAHCSYGPHSGL